jgi:hypothetical protein
MFAPEGGFCLYRTYISCHEVKNGLYGLLEYPNFNDLSNVRKVKGNFIIIEAFLWEEIQ